MTDFDLTAFTTVRTAPWAPVVGVHAQAHALGAPDAMTSGTYWNAPQLPDPGPDAQDTVPPQVALARERLRLKGILKTEVHAQSWYRGVDRYLRGVPMNATPGERALDIREDVLDQRADSHLDIDDWLFAIHSVGAAEGWTDAQINEVCAASVKAFHIEQQLTEDGLLPAQSRIWTYVAHDLSGAVYLLGAGFRLGFTTPEAATRILDAAYANAASVFSSWQQFGVSYIAAQSALYGSYPCDEIWRVATLSLHTLLEDPQSPWLNLPFPQTQSSQIPLPWSQVE